MHDLLIAFAYIAMILAPCVVAQWGDSINLQGIFRLGASQQLATEAALVADVPRYAIPALAIPPRRFARSSAFASTVAAEPRIVDMEAFLRDRARVAARLAQIAEEHHLAQMARVQAGQEAAGAVRAREVAAAVRQRAPGRTLSPAELEMLYRMAWRKRSSVSARWAASSIPPAHNTRAEEVFAERPRGVPILSAAA